MIKKPPDTAIFLTKKHQTGNSATLNPSYLSSARFESVAATGAKMRLEYQAQCVV